MVFVTNFPVGKECGFPLVEPRILTGHMIDRRRVLISGYHLISSNEIYKEILHEIGHCWGLDHYQKRHSSMWCVMNANIPLDLRDDWYCEKCESKLRQIGVLAHE
jgi:predicted Zn-dependent protease